MRMSIPPSSIEVRDNIAIGDVVNVPVKITVTALFTSTTTNPDGEIVEETTANGIIELSDGELETQPA